MKTKIVFITVVAVLLFGSHSYSATILPGEDAFLTALSIKESNRRTWVTGDVHMVHKAFGDLQIRQPCVDDVNAKYGTKYRAEDMLNNPVRSRWMCREYLTIHATFKRLGRNPTFDDLARIWNGGPPGCFDNGAINKKGTRPKDLKVRADLARQQARAKRYAQEVRQIMDHQVPLLAQRK